MIKENQVQKEAGDQPTPQWRTFQFALLDVWECFPKESRVLENLLWLQTDDILPQ